MTSFNRCEKPSSTPNKRSCTLWLSSEPASSETSWAAARTTGNSSAKPNNCGVVDYHRQLAGPITVGAPEHEVAGVKRQVVLGQNLK